MITPLKFPFYIKAALVLIGFYFLIDMLYVAQALILPVVYAAIIAVLLSPGVNFLVNKKINRALAVSAVLLIAVLIATGLIALLTTQASLFREAWPHFTKKSGELIYQTVTWASGYLNISAQSINGCITDAEKELINNRTSAIGITLSTMGGIIAGAMLTPVYVFMVLFYQPLLIEFVHKLFGADNDSDVNEILTKTKGIIRSYLVGLFLEFVIISIMNSAGLLILRIDYAVLLGIIGALLNVIPLIGGVICVLLFVVVALVTKSPIYVLYVVALYTLIQFIDNHFIVPKIVGSKVKLNALVCLIAVFAGSALWGIPGMFLSIPLMAIVKLIMDHVDALKPWGFLLGGTSPTAGNMKFNFTIKGFFPGLRSKKNKE